MVHPQAAQSTPTTGAVRELHGCVLQLLLDAELRAEGCPDILHRLQLPGGDLRSHQMISSRTVASSFDVTALPIPGIFIGHGSANRLFPGPSPRRYGIPLVRPAICFPYLGPSSTEPSAPSGEPQQT